MEPYPSALVDSTPFGRHWARVSLGRRYRARAFGHFDPVEGGWAERCVGEGVWAGGRVSERVGGGMRGYVGEWVRGYVGG